MIGTMERTATPTQIVTTGVVAILRSHSPEHVVRTVDALVEGGITCVEITMTTPGCLDSLRDLRERHGDDIAIGAGTVTDGAAVESALAAGADFVVSPCVSEDVIETARDAGVPGIVGAWSPTEVLRAWRLGASAIKLFPASSGGVAHLRSLREPFPDIPLIPTGGVTADLVADFLGAGALAVGLGGALTGQALRTGETGGMRDDVARVLEAVATGRARR
ncbi:bifunctional 4-hydroxy-2-oxoglutarate aldolase/2-dehydro-3-deoxy-phosphogluconate aldolase [Streptosporangium carneum]|uniref:2-keto-3-deoxy-phosphogluconate aldolase n=1 Tax=Streptosporangium carneum TaxID=47481 RepID=A0A9W6I650_9ACTN|nr:bifunctional 4-hydroxy-2-oxoglutarate aldolase/2-dehydro-3-deoxy-phosphogluconate aldolase [Streptosporangium carneum]GLK12765.1 2-keto-3-deoxy-phosphogluconate aldolase [Streptosporangium carneum]